MSSISARTRPSTILRLLLAVVIATLSAERCSTWCRPGRYWSHSARLTGELRRQYRASPGLAAADLVVAATTRHVGAALATHNLRHYPMFAGLAEPY